MMKGESAAERKERAGAAFVSRMLRAARRGIIFVVGISVLAVGIAMIVLPGPAIVVIPSGLAILATEFLWARCLLRKMAERLEKTKPLGERS
jgi:uncharacterized protein (TIGR02611 family)